MNKRIPGYLMGASLLVLGAVSPAFAQDKAAASTAQTNTLTEIVVTAQRREQNVQNVPIAVTALTQAEMATNRVSSVNDLSLLTPGFTVMPSAGGTQIPTFTMRGITSYGVVPGSDKAISMYVDGVYISSARGSIFDLPDISQIEVLRGPQGTLFGRNAIGGAISITTRDPAGKFGLAQDFTGGNYNEFRSRTTVDTPTWGPFSGYVSFVHDERRGDTKNLGAGTVWNYSNATTSDVPKTQTSPKYLGSKNENNVFAALKFEPTDWFSTVYKFDHSDNHSTPEAVAFLGSPIQGGVPAGLGLVGSVLTDSSGKRPDAVNNAFSTQRRQVTEGHSLTSKIEGDSFAIKNIASYRESLLVASDALDGLGGLTTGSAYGPFAGLPVEVLGVTNETRSRQWSDELQYIYHSKLLTLTVGGLVFQTKDQNGATPGIPTNVTSLGPLGPIPFYITPTANGLLIPSAESVFYNKGQSIAAYSQVELHVTSNVDLVGGIRETKDWKSGANLVTVPAGIPAPPASFDYTANAPSYLIGVNYKPTNDTMVYAKYSTAFVSGGEVAGVPFAPETVNSWEAGFKGEFFDHRLRANLSIYDATYYHLQEAEGGSTLKNPLLLAQYPWIPALGTFVVDQGGHEIAKGAEFEGTWLVGHGVTLGSNIAYTEAKYYNVNSDVDDPGPGQIAAGSAGVPPYPLYTPKWTVGLWGNYATTFDNGLKGSVRIDANWRSDFPLAAPGKGVEMPVYAPFTSAPPTWVVNGRAVLSGFQLHGVNAEVALWAKNLTDDRSLNYALLISQLVGVGNFQPARTFGVDLHFKY